MNRLYPRRSLASDKTPTSDTGLEEYSARKRADVQQVPRCEKESGIHLQQGKRWKAEALARLRTLSSDEVGA